MQVIKLKNRVIYRADKGKKLKFINDGTKHQEISTEKETNRIVEVNE